MDRYLIKKMSQINQPNNQFYFVKDVMIQDVLYIDDSHSVKEAYELLKLNTLLFPDGFNTWDSLAMWYYATGDYENARTYYQKSYDLNPDNTYAKRKVDEINNMKK